jgi:uncharacterized repeat protein (TIGR03803 family)
MGKSFTRSAGATLAVTGLLIALSVLAPAQAQTSDIDYARGKVLFSFPPDMTGGVRPMGGVIRDSAGNFYGTAAIGGDLRPIAPQAVCGIGCGTVFKVDKTGKETVLHAFSGQFSDFDGNVPEAGLVMDSAGNLYGTTSSGGDYGDFPSGVIFKIDPTGKETILYQFNINYGDGQYPTSTLSPDGQGNFYGTLSDGSFSPGSVFKVDAQGNYSQIYLFQGIPDGALPYRSRMLMDAAGNLYGVTRGGGNNCDPHDVNGCGVVFELSPDGSSEKVLYAFQGGRDGAHPVGDMAWDAAGNLIGVTYNGGTNDTGVVFRVTKTGHETILYNFGPGLDGQPESGVVVDASGIYGTTRMGGAYHQGSVFKLDRHGVMTTLRSFDGGPKGGRPWGQLLLDSGVLYGTTIDGGEWGTGTIYQIVLP